MRALQGSGVWIRRGVTRGGATGGSRAAGVSAAGPASRAHGVVSWRRCAALGPRASTSLLALGSRPVVRSDGARAL
eukprot:11707725-Alexandrium_andersonii.AAC.1